MLAGAGLSNDAFLAHALSQKCLANAVVDLVRARVQEVFALQVNSGAAKMLCKSASEKQRSGPPGKLLKQILQALTKASILASILVRALQFIERRHQSLWDVLAPKISEASR